LNAPNQTNEIVEEFLEVKSTLNYVHFFPHDRRLDDFQEDFPGNEGEKFINLDDKDECS
jgi:hypothetical protein